MERRPLELAFHVGPVPVVVEPSFWLIALLFGMPSGRLDRLAVGIPIVFVSLLVHELGHAFSARLLGTSAEIRLYAFGGLTFPHRRMTRWRDVAMSVAGPLCSFALAGAVLALSALWKPSSELANLALTQLVRVNVGWGLLNLMPVLPLDGGHLLLGLFGPARQKQALLAGGLFAVGLAGIAAWRQEVFLAVLFGVFAFYGFQAWAAARRLPATGSMSFDEALARGWRALSEGKALEAQRLALAVVRSAADPDVRNRGRDLLAWCALAEARAREALNQIEQSEPAESARALTRALILEALDEAEQAVPYALQAAREEPSETSGQLAVRLLATARRFDEAQLLAERFAWPRPGLREVALAEVDFRRGAYRSAAEHYRAAFEAGGAADSAFRAARSFARGGEPGEAVAWMKRALEAGFREFEEVANDPALAQVRADPEIERLMRERQSAP